MQSAEAVQRDRQRAASEAAARRQQERHRARARVRAAQQALDAAERALGAARRDLAFWEALEGTPMKPGTPMKDRREAIPEQTTIEPWP